MTDLFIGTTDKMGDKYSLDNFRQFQQMRHRQSLKNYGYFKNVFISLGSKYAGRDYEKDVPVTLEMNDNGTMNFKTQSHADASFDKGNMDRRLIEAYKEKGDKVTLALVPPFHSQTFGFRFCSRETKRRFLELITTLW